MMIRDHRIDGVRYVKARSFGGPEATGVTCNAEWRELP